MSEECSHNCSECASDCEERTAPQSLLEQMNEASDIKKVIGIVSGKGGVGKSMVTSLLAAAMKKKGYSSAVLDADVTGPSIPKMFGINTARIPILPDMAAACDRGEMESADTKWLDDITTVIETAYK